MSGLIGFEGYRFKSIIGVLPHERQHEQELILDMKVETDFTAAGKSDDLNDTIDYVRLSQLCCQIATDGRYFLLEKYATELTAAVLSHFPVKSVWVRIRKPRALKDADCAIVEYQARRG